MKTAVVALALLAAPLPVVAQQHTSPYAHTGSDVVKTLSRAEVEDLLSGAGMGLARPAELNGLPGPKHVLELADSLALTPDQRRGVQAAFDAMDGRARELGGRVIDAERALDALFAAGRPAPDAIREAVRAAAAATADLRMVHLEAHLRVAALLTPRQIQDYARLRGYAAHAHHGG